MDPERDEPEYEVEVLREDKTPASETDAIEQDGDPIGDNFA